MAALQTPKTLGGRARPPIEIPDGHVGLVELPGTERRVWWTGRVAIGLRYERPRSLGPLPQSANWIQQLVLAHAP